MALVAFLALIIGTIFGIIYFSSRTNRNDTELKQKEFELQRRELELKKKEMDLKESNHVVLDKKDELNR